jgi:hemoglobin-like flavoprotein
VAACYSSANESNKQFVAMIRNTLMSPGDIHLIQASFAHVEVHAELVAALFYRNLFELDPTLKPLFHSDMLAQGRKLMTMLALVVSGLERLDALVPAVEALGARHAAYGVRDTHFVTVGVALLQTLGQGLGAAFTPAVEAAWTKAYALLAATMQAGLRQARSAETALLVA